MAKMAKADLFFPWFHLLLYLSPLVLALCSTWNNAHFLFVQTSKHFQFDALVVAFELKAIRWKTNVPAAFFSTLFLGLRIMLFHIISAINSQLAKAS